MQGLHESQFTFASRLQRNAKEHSPGFHSHLSLKITMLTLIIEIHQTASNMLYKYFPGLKKWQSKLFPVQT